MQEIIHPEPVDVPLPKTGRPPASCRGDVFVGRLRERKALLRALQDAREGFGGIVLLLGEPGIGKTRTAEEFSGQARSRGAAVLWGRCHEGEETPPYGPWTAALRPLIRSIDAQVLRQSMGEGAADIAQILPELQRSLGGLEPSVRLPTPDGEQCLFSSLAVFLRSMAQSNPLVIILDNLHLADPGSLKFLRHFASELTDCRLLILGTCRNPEEARRDPLAATIEELAKTRRFQRLHLDGLGKEEVRELLRRSLPRPSDAQAEAIHARTEGNPLFIVELVRQVLATPGSDVTMPTLPEGIRQAIGRRLARLPPRCVEVLRIASVLGQGFDRQVLLRMVGETRPDETEGALEEARSAAVVDEYDPGMGRCRFVHALVRETLLDGIPPAERVRLHLRAGQAMREICGSDPGPRSVEILDHLLEAADAVDPADLLGFTLRVADQVMARYAPDQALAIIDRACAAWERLGRAIDPGMARIQHLRGRILTDLQRPGEAKDSLVRAFNLFLAGGDVPGAIGVALTPAMEKVGGVWMTSVVAGGRGVDELRAHALELAPPDSVERAWLLVQRGAPADLDAARSFARRSGNVPLEAAAVSQLAYQDLLAMDLDSCARHLGEASTAAAPLHDPWISFGCVYTRYYHGLMCGDPGEAGSAVDDLFELARGARSRRMLTVAHRCAAVLSCKRGLWDTARDNAGRVLLLLAGAGSVANNVFTLRALFEMELQTGHVKAALRWRERQLRLYDVPCSADIRLDPLGARVTGDMSLMPPAPERVELPAPDVRLLTFAINPLLQQAVLAAVHRDKTAAAGCLERLRRWRMTFLDRSTDGLLGQLCSVLGRLDESAGHFVDALDFCRRAGYRPELAWTCLEFAEVLVLRDGAGDRERALGLLSEGMETARDLQMLPLRNLIKAAQGRLSGRSVRSESPPASPDGLTSREIEVLRLVARGFTNAEIAARLFISPLTAARHVHNLLDKTGMANRAEAVAYATRHGLTDG